MQETEKYLTKEKKVTVFVSRIATSINVKPIQIYIGDEYQIENALNPAGAGKLTYESMDWDLFDVDENGLITTYDMDGSAEVLISFGGNYKYEPSNATALVTIIKKTINPEDYKFGVSVRDEFGRATFSITLPKEFTGNFIITIDGEDTYSARIVNGVAKYTVDGLRVGKHNVTMSYAGNAIYSGVKEFQEFSIASIKIDKNRNVNVVYLGTATYSVHLTKNTQALQGKIVTFVVNGKRIYARTSNNGYATIKVKLPAIKSYIITAQYGKIRVVNKINVKHVVVAKNVVAKKSASSVKIKVSLNKVNNRYLSGKKVTLRFNGKTLVAKTNKYGVAMFAINKNLYSKLAVGKQYVYKVTFLKDTVSRKITIAK